jgi:hypothetical protein
MTFQLESQVMAPPEDRSLPRVGSDAWLAVAYGGGTNSCAKLCGFRERGIKPAIILFSDTAGEMPHTYQHIHEVMQKKVREWWGMEIETVRATFQGKPQSLESECLRLKHLPALAYGSRNCSQRYKHEPQQKRLAEWCRENNLTRFVQTVGYGADERYRVREEYRQWHELRKGIECRVWHPLIEWNWTRDDCIAAIKRHGLPLPGKSACFFCPAMKPGEVLRLRDTHPELLARALAIEAAAKETTDRGLGGEGNLWANWLATDASQGKLPLDISPVDIPCGCFDGDDACSSANK